MNTIARRRSAKDLSTTLLSWLESAAPIQATATQQQSRSWVTQALSSRQHHWSAAGSGTAEAAMASKLFRVGYSMHEQSLRVLRTGCYSRMIASSAHVHQGKDQSRGEDQATMPGSTEHPPEQPPGVLTTITAMGAGAGGAVLVAAIGVWAVFQMAFWVAGEAGRSIKTTDASVGVVGEHATTTTAGEDSPIQSTRA
ncbi:hypothetical protein M9434_006719 [Picochlorum sp. BPE23]|nr:hypothetical protein M9434_006719 [Picochlorum sp. BPE23]